MMVLILLLLAFALPLICYSPEPENLRETKRPDIKERLTRRCGTLLLGTVLIAIAACTFDLNQLKITPSSEALLALSRHGVFDDGRAYQIVTSNFVHINLLHLISNLSLLMLLSLYEWRVGIARFFAVFFFAAIVSSLIDLVAFPAQAVFLGASGGICGLAAAYFVDHENVSRKEWGIGIAMMLLLVALYSFIGKDDEAKLGASINWLAHLSGALAGGIYVRLATGGKRMTPGQAQRGRSG
jgi:rhomboid protease GluP